MRWYALLAVLLPLLKARAAKAQQATEKVLRPGAAGIVEAFSVLKSNRAMRQGAYLRYRPLGGKAGVAVLEAGNYALI